MKTKAFRSIAVIGQLRTGKETICRLIGEKISSPRKGPRRYEITMKGFPRLQGYVLTIYSKLEHLNLDMSERAGVIVLTPDKIKLFCGEQRFIRQRQFLELIGKLCWLGVDRYIVVVTHIDDQEKTGIGAWFYELSQQFSEILENDFKLKVEACVPVGRKDKHHWYNIQRSESWYASPCLAEALENLVSSPEQRPNSLWVVGSAVPGDDKTFRLKTEGPSRGTFCENAPIHIFLDHVDAPEGLYGDLKMDVRPKNSAILSVRLQEGTLRQTSPVVLVSGTAPARYPAVVRVDALLKEGVDIDELPAMDLDVTFFGPHRREGQISNTSKPLYKQLYTSHFHPSLGQRVYLEFHMSQKPVIEPFSRDPEAGRVLIWRKALARSPVNLIAVGRIVSFFDYEIQHLVNQLIQIDQLQFTTYREQFFLTRELEHLIHDVKRDIEMLLYPENMKAFDHSQIQKFDESFERIIRIVKSLMAKPVFEEYRNLAKIVMRNLDELKDRLVRSLQEVEDYNNNPTEEFIDSKLSIIVKDYEELKRLINKRTTRPIRNFVNEAMLAYEKKGANFSYDAQYYIHVQLPQNMDYYPVETSFSAYGNPDVDGKSFFIDEAIKDGIEELLNNSIKHHHPVNQGQDLRIDIFIDPPSVEEPPRVKVWFQDNGILTKEILEDIRNSTHGWRNHQKRLAEKYNIELGVSDHIGFGTTCFLTIPVWVSRPNKLQNMIKLIAALHHVDYERQKQTGVCPDFLGQFSKALNTLKNREEIESKLQKLRADIEQEIETLVNFPGWIKPGKSQFDEIINILRATSDDEIQQVKGLLGTLQQQPVLNMVRDVRDKVWADIQNEIRYFGKSFDKEELICITLSNFPPYRLLYPAKYLLIKDTLSWGLKEFIVGNEEGRSVSIEYRMSDNRKKVELLLSGIGIRSSGQKLLAFRTRLANLGISNHISGDSEDTLVLSIPVWMIKKKR